MDKRRQKHASMGFDKDQRELSPVNLEDYIEPINKEEIQTHVEEIMYLIELAKNSRSEVLSFDPRVVQKEPQIGKLKKRLKNLQRENKVLEETNIVRLIQHMKKEIKALESHNVRKEGQQKFKNSPKKSGLVDSLRDFNKHAHQEILKLTKEIEADTYDYGLDKSESQ